MTTEHTERAMKTARYIFKRWIYNVGYDREQITKDGSKRTIGDQTIEMIAAIIDHETGLPELQAKIDRLEADRVKKREMLKEWKKDVDYLNTELIKVKAEKAELVEACQFFMTALETGLLVRDISKDGQSDWALKMMDFTRQLQKAQAAIAKAAPESGEKEKGNEKA